MNLKNKYFSYSCNFIRKQILFLIEPQLIIFLIIYLKKSINYLIIIQKE
jgi:hypothetical protein